MNLKEFWKLCIMPEGKSFIHVLIDKITDSLQELDQGTETGFPFEEAMHLF